MRTEKIALKDLLKQVKPLPKDTLNKAAYGLRHGGVDWLLDFCFEQGCFTEKVREDIYYAITIIDEDIKGFPCRCYNPKELLKLLNRLKLTETVVSQFIYIDISIYK